MTPHLDDFLLSELTDARAVPAPAGEHLRACDTCRARLGEWRALRAEASLERLRTHETPDPWPVIAARTVYRDQVRRRVLRSLRLPLAIWTLVAFALGVIATEGVRTLSRQLAEQSWRLNRQAEALRPK